MLSGAPGRRGERGQVIVFFALLIPVIFAIGALVIDFGNWYVHKRHLQTQVDAAVLAAASTFGGCFDDQTLNKTVANTAILTTAARYAGDTLRDPAAVNKQLAEPGDVRVVFNADRYWDSSDGTSNASTGYGLDFGGNDPAKMPCQTSSLEAKATDEHVRPLWGLIPLTPSPKAHARIEIHRVRAENGFLPIAVPEIDPNFVYAIYVDYRDDGTQVPIKVQELQPNPGYGGANFLYADWTPQPDSKVAGNSAVLIHSNNTQSDGVGVVILVSKSDTKPSKTGTLNQICNQPPTDLVACYAGTGADYDGAANGQGLAFIHSYDTGGGTAAQPVLKDVTLNAPTVCTGGMSLGNQSSPYFVNDDSNCTVGVTATVDFGNFTGNITRAPNQNPAGICATVSGLTWQSTDPATHISTWTGSMSVPSDDVPPAARAGPQVLTLGWSDKATGNGCNGGTSGSFGPATMAYSQDGASGPVGYLNLTATGFPSGNGGQSCPQGASWTDAHSVARGNGNYDCYTVDVGFTKPLQVQPWDFPDIVLRTASKAAKKVPNGNGQLNGSLLCDSGRTLVATFTTGCFTTYALNYDKWGTGITPYGTTTTCAAGALCWEDVLCAKYSPSDLPPSSTVNTPPPDCVAAKNGQVQAFQQAVYNRWEDPANRFGACPPNNWPTDATTASTFFNSVDATPPGHDFTNDPRYITLIVTDNTAFSKPNVPEPVKYFAGFYVTGWDTDNGSGKPKGCYGNNPPGVDKCGAPNNDAHPLLGCLAGKTITADNGDVWGHFVRTVVFSSSANASDDLCDLTLSSPETCVAVLVE